MALYKIQFIANSPYKIAKCSHYIFVKIWKNQDWQWGLVTANVGSEYPIPSYPSRIEINKFRSITPID